MQVCCDYVNNKCELLKIRGCYGRQEERKKYIQLLFAFFDSLTPLKAVA